MSSTGDYIKRTFLGSILDLKIRTPKFIHNSRQPSYNISSGSRAHSSAPFNSALSCSSKTTLQNGQRQRQSQQAPSERHAQRQQQHNEQYVHNQPNFRQQQRSTFYPVIRTDQQQQPHQQQRVVIQQYQQPQQQLEQHQEQQQEQQSKCENHFFDEKLYCGPTANFSLSDHLSESLFLASPTTSSSATTCNSPTQTAEPVYGALPIAYNNVNASGHLTDYSGHLTTQPISKDAFSSSTPYAGATPSSSLPTNGPSSATVTSPHDIYRQIVHECEPFLDQRCSSRYDLAPEGPEYRTADNACIISKRPRLAHQRRLIGGLPSVTFHHERHVTDVPHSYDNRIYSHIDTPITYTTTSAQQQKADSMNFNAQSVEVLPPSYPPPPPYDQHYESSLVTPYDQFCDIEVDKANESVALDADFEVNERFVKTLIEKLVGEILSTMETSDAERFTQLQRRAGSDQMMQQLNAIFDTLLPLEKLSLEQLIKMVIAAVRDTRKDDDTTASTPPSSAMPVAVDTEAILSFSPSSAAPDTDVAVPLSPSIFNSSPASVKRAESTTTASETPEEILQRKRQQNNLAAARYRKRQREAKILAQSEIFDLERRNAELKNKILIVKNKINALKRQFVATEPSSPIASIHQSPLELAPAHSPVAVSPL